LDVVDIILPHYLHYEAAITALRAGNNVLLEKPMALTVEECDQILKLVQKNYADNKKKPALIIGFELRLSRLWGRVKELIQQGKIGTPSALNIEVFTYTTYLGSEKWRLDKKQIGSWILDSPIHYIDLIRWYFEGTGKPQSLYSTANSLHSDRTLIDNFFSIIQFSNNNYATLSFTMGGYGYHIAAKIIGDKGAIWAYWKEAEDNNSKPNFFLEYGQDKIKHQVTIEGQVGETFDLKTEIQQVVKVIRGKAHIPATGWDGREAVRLCLALEKSLESSEIIKGHNLVKARRRIFYKYCEVESGRDTGAT